MLFAQVLSTKYLHHWDPTVVVYLAEITSGISFKSSNLRYIEGSGGSRRAVGRKGLMYQSMDWRAHRPVGSNFFSGMATAKDSAFFSPHFSVVWTGSHI